MKTNAQKITTFNNSTHVRVTLRLIFIVLTSFFFMISCDETDDTAIQQIDNTDDDDEINILSGDELMASISNTRENAIQDFIVNGDTGATIYGSKGTHIYFPPNGFEDLSGNPITGDVVIELIEIYDRASMLTQKMPTNGKQTNGDVVTILSGGEFYINATQGGTQLQPSTTFELSAPTDDFDPEMTVFIPENCDDIDCDVVWEEDEEARIEEGEIQNEDGTWTFAYVAPLTSFGWTNLDRWWSYEGAKTMVYVDVPEGFNETNSAVYVSYDGEPNTLALFDIYDTDLEMFSEHYGQMPVGQEVHFIFVSVQNDEYVYAIQGVTIVNNHTEVITSTEITTETGLTALINALP